MSEFKYETALVADHGRPRSWCERCNIGTCHRFTVEKN